MTQKEAQVGTDCKIREPVLLLQWFIYAPESQHIRELSLSIPKVQSRNRAEPHRNLVTLVHLLLP